MTDAVTRLAPLLTTVAGCLIGFAGLAIRQIWAYHILSGRTDRHAIGRFVIGTVRQALPHGCGFRSTDALTIIHGILAKWMQFRRPIIGQNEAALILHAHGLNAKHVTDFPFVPGSCRHL